MDPQHEQSEQERLERERRARIQAKLKAAMELPNVIKPSFWGKTPLMSPRVAALMSDKETAELFMRAVRDMKSKPGA